MVGLGLMGMPNARNLMERSCASDRVSGVSARSPGEAS
jgi:3-hydroxyisobutyrate dehydrogenase-like beta-hydroxyacid dehydrogenase